MTNDRHFDAQIIEVRPHRIEDELARGRVVIVAGYQGMSYKREITTLGRGGSDTTAVALAAALGAERCEIYSDVDGVYSADPQSVADARHLPSISYDTMQEIAESGAKVLNARAVEWARKHRVVIHARKTKDFAEHGSGRETRIEASTVGEPMAIILDSKLAWVEAPSAAREQLFSAIELTGAPIRDAWFDERLRLLLSLTSVPHFERSAALLLEAGALHVRVDVAAVSAVAVGIGHRTERLTSALARVPPSALATSLSPLRLSVVLPLSEASALEHAWHALLC